MLMLMAALLLSTLVAPVAFGNSPALEENSPSAGAKDKQSAQSSGETDPTTNSTLTGDWGGSRSTLADNGVSLDFRHTSFYQGLASGTGNKDFEYGGKFDVFINLDSSKMGLWEGGGIRTHIEYSHGDLATNIGGTLFATNTALYWPVGAPEEVVATSLNFTQKVGEKSSIAVGKFNPVDVYEHTTSMAVGGSTVS